MKLSPPQTNSFEIVKREFDETLGYIRGDLQCLLDKKLSLNYTIGLLVGCGCEMLAACRGKNRLGETVFAELLPSGELQDLAKCLYSALRDGLAHGFDTKHLLVEGQEHQIYLNSEGSQEIKVIFTDRGLGLRIGMRDLAEKLCQKISEFEELLKSNESARLNFMNARQPNAELHGKAKGAWKNLVARAGY